MGGKQRTIEKPPARAGDTPGVPPRRSQLPVWLCGRAAWTTAGLLAGAFALLFVVPWQPAEEGPIGSFDFSWMLVLHDAVANHRQFGPQVILPQGPMGFFGTNVYDPRTYPFLIALRSLATAAVFWSLWRGAKRLLTQPVVALPWLIAIVALIGRTPDHFFPACALLTAFMYFVVDGRKATVATFALTVTLAAASLIKVNQPFYVAVALGTITLDGIAQRARRAWLGMPLAYLVSLVAFYLATGQSPRSVGSFLWAWKSVTAGHTDAVGLPGPWIDVLAYLCVVAMVVALAALFAWRQKWGRVGAVMSVCATAGVLLLLYKHSFMRQDIHHVHMGPMVATAAAMLYAAALWPDGGRLTRTAALSVVTIAGIVTSSLLSSYTNESLLGYAGSSALRTARNASAALSLVTDPHRLHREWEAARQKLRDDNPVPLAGLSPGPVDVYPHRQDLVFAYHLPYSPRPVVSSLVATAPSLSAVNFEHIRGPNAAPNVLFDIDLVDRNYPTMLDGKSFPELLTRYDVTDSSGALLILRRSQQPRSYRLTPLSTTSAQFEEAIKVPDPGVAPIWASVKLKPRGAGKVWGMLYKPPTLGIQVRTRDGKEDSFRFLPSLAEADGFLLSPLIANRGAYAKLASKSWRADLAPAAVETMTIFVADGARETFYEADFTVEFQRLEFDRPQ